jgi:outer membrane protein
MQTTTSKGFARAAALLVVVALLLPVPPASAAERPKWELGVGSVFFTQPDYVGSDEYRFRPIPFPWIIYRGERLRLDRESMQTKIFRTDLVRLDLSASGQVSVDSGDNDRRDGMPDRDWIAQVGPALRFSLKQSEDGRHTLDLEVSLRAALAVSFDNFSYEGLVASPKFQYRYEPETWRFDANAGLEFSNNDYNEYYYTVPARFATASRPAYGAGGGYAGLRLAAGAGRYFGPIYLGLFARYINLEGATFVDSPLVGARHAFIGGLAVGWVWKSSSEMVPVGAEANLRRRARERDEARQEENDAADRPASEEAAPDAAPDAPPASPETGGAR